jgi:NADH:ubiquinone oxidoreductase subunit E
MRDHGSNEKVGSVLVVGAGIGGMQAALDLAESGIKVYLADKKACIGGVMSQLDKTFPTNDCAMCTMAPRLVEIGRHKDIELITLADIEEINGKPGNFTVKLKKRARYIDEDKCTGCGACIENCPVRYIIYPPPEDGEGVKLKPEDKKRVDKIVDAYKDKKPSLMPILQNINLTYNYLPADVLRYVSKKLTIACSLIYQIATFYHAFSLKPRGRHLINVCMGTTCYVRGAQTIVERLSSVLDIGVGETTKDLKFTLLTVRCLGCCSIAPVITIDTETYGRLKTREIPKILKGFE